MIRKFEFQFMVFAIMLSFVLASCVPLSSVQIDIGSFVKDYEARQAFVAAENALLALDLKRYSSGSVDNERETREEDAKFISSAFIDPISPPNTPSETWFVAVQYLKPERSVRVLLQQPGANKPSAAMLKRSEELLLELQKLLPAFPVRKA